MADKKVRHAERAAAAKDLSCFSAQLPGIQPDRASRSSGVPQANRRLVRPSAVSAAQLDGPFPFVLCLPGFNGPPKNKKATKIIRGV
jgi:hypothetical protein